jgi:hypothetical protein
MREFRIECLALASLPPETAWDLIADQAQLLLTHFAPQVSFRQPARGWAYSQDEWHHWNAVFDEQGWVATGTFIYAAVVALMLRADPDLAGFAASLYYCDDGGKWLECG